MESRDARRVNRAAVLSVLLSDGSASRMALAKCTGLSKATVSRVVEDLLAEGLIKESGPLPADGPGRQPYALHLAADAGLAAGVDMGGSSTRFLLADLTGRVLVSHRAATPQAGDAAEVAAFLAETLASLAAGHPGGITSTTVGLPGAVHPGTRAVRSAPNLPQIEGTAFTEAVAASIPGAVAFENDTNCALIGEVHAGAAHGRRDAVMVTIGTGLGVSVQLDGKLLPGRTGAVGEFGALPYADGTLEDAISGKGLTDKAPRATPAEILAGDLHPELRDKARRALETLLRLVTVAYEPEVIVLGGGVSASLLPWHTALERSLTDLTPEPPSVVTSALGDPAGAAGALIAALGAAHRAIGVDAPVPAVRLTPKESHVPAQAG
ncbi:ROK family transcriptional regulator [Nonomuraea rhodomycinica]|uniref:ROK family transcriptional regulator n=1 Tax=Nonomuraea rhodomycinica TaxID=1712872 RepID=A0A7Y6IVT2_9ACTN|nr:ROK family transcriptional regulator [Nonomuraea rhodomycinica]NUW44983.1 ROK family transcriptional regulator [Nonomuraea rhodomycinica]